MAPIATSTDPSKEVLNHGMALNPENKRVQCCYCGKVVSGFSRLQHHLGGIKGNIAECVDVPEEVKEYFRDTLIAVRVGRLVKEVGDLDQPGPSSSKRRCSSNGRTQNKLATVQEPRLVTELAADSSDKSVVLRACSSKQGLNSASISSKRCIGRFFFENGIEFAAVVSPAFRSMIGNFLKHDKAIHSIPSISELKGWIMEEELNDIENYVKQARLSWARTGCSILLDGWTDHSGRSLINVIVECPEGAVYLRSADVSPTQESADALQLFLESVLEEVGIQNVVQIVTYTFSESMEAVSRQLIEKYKSLFWTVSASHCLSLILDKIAHSNKIKGTLEKVKTITQFIYNRSAVLKLLRRHIGSHDLVIPSKIKAATPFLTLENFLEERSNLERMFTSSEWLGSCEESSNEGKSVAVLIGASSFWGEVVTAVKASIPLVRAMSLINGDEPHMGFIYETMDQIKETICEEFGGEDAEYCPYWDMIDEIWNTILHSPLHAAGYFLNPRLYFTEDFYSDTEVASGLLITIVRMVNDQRTQDMISNQVDMYGTRQGDFKSGINTKDSLSPTTWWSRYGGHCPELQNLAVRILSQTCNGAESYGLKRDLAEKLLSKTERNVIEQQQMLNLTYLHYNLKLKQSKVGAKFDIVADELDPTDDWIIDRQHDAEASGSGSEPRVQMDGLSIDRTLEGRRPSGVVPKVEPA